MKTDQAEYWTNDLSPFIFQVQELNLQWMSSFWGLLSIVLFLGSGYIISFYAKNKLTRNPEKPFLFFNSNFKIEILLTTLTYCAIILAVLFFLKKENIAWGLRWYSMMYLAGFISVYLGCLYWIKKGKLNLTESKLINLITAGIFGMLIGARFAYVFIYNFDSYKNNPWEIFATWEGGLSFHGGIVGVCCAIYLFCRYYKIPFLHVTDKITLFVPIGIMFGRIGNFFNGELWGRPIQSHIPWAVVFPQADQLPRHPSQIYQSLGEGLLLFITLQFLSKIAKKEGQTSCFFIIFYGLYRFVIEFFREADAHINYFLLNSFSWGPKNIYAPWWLTLTMGQILCLLTSVTGVLILIFISNISKQK
ncbi:MAG: prolipoprotein diacylglyceryl transferase [Silvanigrellaceae bacterium]|nr:prolipoprotein diacylglyceryl transferase [Silvanigrellaceae bacterium]